MRGAMKIQILCRQCQECILLEKNVMAAAKSIGIEFELERIERQNRRGLSGVMGRPELVINGEVRSIGRVLSPEELKKMFNFILRAQS
ncbi:MAG TPA: thioredoxin family protein [Desulfobulbaceae bacterium]|nr:thioredoxin family protein [Desulfobulbaceae bacterium]